jgi:uncharacterized protein YndB with AHSA1/START domain
MTTMADQDIFAPVQKSITVRASAERTFQVFTKEFDSWWPRSHHIGKSPLKRAVIEGRVGGRCYSEQDDGIDCPWGFVLEWDPPRRFVFSWNITHEWGYEPDTAKASEVEVRFTPVGEGQTRVDLEHRHFERHGIGGATMRAGVSAEGGWGTLLGMFAERVNQAA